MKNRLGQKLWATISQIIKALLGWKFQVQDLFHEFEVLLVSLAHLVVHIGWAYAKCSYETDPYPPNHISLISPICRKNGYQQWSINAIHRSVRVGCISNPYPTRSNQVENFQTHSQPLRIFGWSIQITIGWWLVLGKAKNHRNLPKSSEISSDLARSYKIW